MKFAYVLVLMIWPMSLFAQDRDFTLSAPQELWDTGLLKHILPRFSLKHGVRITQVDQNGDVVIGDEGAPAFSGLGKLWHLSEAEGEGPVLFAQWLFSDIGKRTVNGFKLDGEPVFTTDISVAVEIPDMAFDGDPIAGESLSLEHCGRCHVVNETNRMKGMGQTPSFGVMRTFEDWDARFATFYVLNPHPSFSQVTDITPAFRSNLPPAIVPLEITQDELEDILAYVATIAPADLGAPPQSQ